MITEWERRRRIEKDGRKYFNWGFGDLIIDEATGEYQIDDKAESNNGDVKTVFYTVISTLTDFFDIHPDATVHVEGSNRQRIEVYKGLMYRHWKHIAAFYEIRGFINGKIELFHPGTDFEYL